MSQGLGGGFDIALRRHVWGFKSLKWSGWVTGGQLFGNASSAPVLARSGRLTSGI